MIGLPPLRQAQGSGFQKKASYLIIRSPGHPITRSFFGFHLDNLAVFQRVGRVDDNSVGEIQPVEHLELVAEVAANEDRFQSDLALCSYYGDSCAFRAKE